MRHTPRIVRNPRADELAACEQWVRGMLTKHGELFLWNTAGASHARLRAALGYERLLTPEAAQRLLLDAEFAESVDVQRVGATSTFALAADLKMPGLPVQWQQRMRAHLSVAQARHSSVRFLEREVMDVWRDMPSPSSEADGMY